MMAFIVMRRDGSVSRLRPSDLKEVAERDERIRQLEQLNAMLSAEVDRLRHEYDEEVTEFIAGYDAGQVGLPESAEPPDIKHDGWRPGYAWGVFEKLKAEIDRMRPVVEAAIKWNKTNYRDTKECELALDAIGNACDDYQARKLK